MHGPKDIHTRDLERIMRYVKGTLYYGIHLYKSSMSSRVTYTYVDWAGFQTHDVPPMVISYCVYRL